KEKQTGLYFGNRLILPFHANFLKVIIDDEIIYDFSPGSKGIMIVEEKEFTNLYFLEHQLLKDSVYKYEAVNMIAVEKSKNIFDKAKHTKLPVYLEENHPVKLEEACNDMLFIE